MKLEIELDGPHNECLHFRPLARSLCGRFDLNRCCEPQARMMTTRFPKPIPGLKLGIDTDTAQGYLIDPLHDAEHAPTREQIEGMGLKIGKRRETFDTVHVSTWLFWMQRAVQGGWATLVDGKFPDNRATLTLQGLGVVRRQIDCHSRCRSVDFRCQETDAPETWQTTRRRA